VRYKIPKQFFIWPMWNAAVVGHERWYIPARNRREVSNYLAAQGVARSEVLRVEGLTMRWRRVWATTAPAAVLRLGMAEYVFVQIMFPEPMLLPVYVESEVTDAVDVLEMTAALDDGGPVYWASAEADNKVWYYFLPHKTYAGVCNARLKESGGLWKLD